MTEIVRFITPAEPAIIRVIIPGPPGPPGHGSGGDAVTGDDIRPRVDMWDELTGLLVNPGNKTTEALRRDASSDFPMPAVFRDAGVMPPDHQLWRQIADGRYFEYVAPRGMLDASQVGFDPDRDGLDNWNFLNEAVWYGGKKKCGVWIPPNPGEYIVNPDVSYQYVLASLAFSSSQILIVGGGKWQTRIKHGGGTDQGFLSISDMDRIRIAGFCWDNNFDALPHVLRPHAMRIDNCNDWEILDVAVIDASQYALGIQTTHGSYKRARIKGVSIYRSRLDGIDFKDHTNSSEALLIDDVYIENHSVDRDDEDGAGIDIRGIAIVNNVFCKMDDDRSQGCSVRFRLASTDTAGEFNDGGRKSIVNNVQTIVKPAHPGRVSGVSLQGAQSQGHHIYSENCTSLFGSVGISRGASATSIIAVNCVVGIQFGLETSIVDGLKTDGCDLGAKFSDGADAILRNAYIANGVDGFEASGTLVGIKLENVISTGHSNRNWPDGGLVAPITAINCPGFHQPYNLANARDGWCSIGAGAAAGVGVASEEYGDSALHRTQLTFTDVHIPLGDIAGVIARGGLKIYDFPVGLLDIGLVTADLTITKSSAGVNDDWDGDFSLGTATATNDASLTGTEANILPSTPTPQAVAGSTSARSTNKVLGHIYADGATHGGGGPRDLYLNFLVDDTDHNVAATPCDLIVNGIIRIVWATADY